MLCLSACPFVCRSACLSVCLPVCLSASLAALAESAQIPQCTSSTAHQSNLAAAVTHPSGLFGAPQVGTRFTVKGIERPEGEGPDGEAEFPDVELEVLHTDTKVFW